MDVGVILFVFRIGLLVLLWVFILGVMRALRQDAYAASGPVAATAPSLPIPKMGGKGVPRVLEIVEGPLVGSNMSIIGLDEVVLGRGQDADFVVGDDYASGRHARLFKRGNDWYIEDLASRNGTYVSGMRIDLPERVQPGSDIKIGRTTLRLEH